ncbi:MAG: twin-arginine translocase subunit TatC [Proteobacteria bacterium]|nr:twin-arginine translocase subunit TatC [Pseudomonadota bacterium]
MTDDKLNPELEEPEDNAFAEMDEQEIAEQKAAADTAAEDAADASADSEDEEDGEQREMGLLDHLDELRIRVSRAAIAFILGTVACYAFAEQIFGYLVIPLKSVLGETEQLIYTGLAEGFITYIKLASIAGIFIMSPYIFYQFWAFVAPGLYKEERRWVVPLALCSAFFFVGGACFGYFQVFPIAFKFFAGFENEHIRLLPSVKEYLALAIKLLFAFGLSFELPLVIFFLARLGIVDAKGLRGKRKYAILVAFIVSAMLTPPDPFSQLMMAVPLLILYEVGILGAHFFGKKKPVPEAESTEEDA